MPDRLSFDRTVGLLREVIGEFGEDYVYSDPTGDGANCVYVHDGQPSCIVAQVTARAGLPLEEIARIDRQVTGTTVLANEELFEQWFEPRAVRLLGRCQHHQDKGVAWGEALQIALREIGEQE